MKVARRWLVLLPFFLIACSETHPAGPRLLGRTGTTTSADGTTIHYLEGGKGSTALVFVHGWLGDNSVWDKTRYRFDRDYRVVSLDLAGHGQSGRERLQWTVENFAADVVAVVRALNLEDVVLVGHSMSGPITVAAANQLGDRVAALIPVDTMLDVEWDLPPEVWAEFFGGLRLDFPAAVENFFRNFLTAKSSPKEVIDSIVANARLADPSISIPMLERAREFDLKAALGALRVPIHAINSDMNPTRLEVNRKHAPRFDVEIIPGVGHWPQLEDPERFGDALERVLAQLGH